MRCYRVSIVACILLAACSPFGKEEQMGVSLLDGVETTLDAQLQGKPAVVNFWAAWCSFCKDELPLFQRIHEEYSDLAVLGINLQEDEETVQKYWMDGGYTFPTLLDPKKTLKTQFNVFTQPTTLFLDAHGNIVSRKDGPLNEVELEERVQELLLGTEKRIADSGKREVTNNEEQETELRQASNIRISSVPPHLRSWYSDEVAHTVALDEILSGGPSKDDIPSIDDPKFISIEDVDFLTDESPGVLISIRGDTRFYPFSILNWHEIVNDTVGGEPIAVTYCPLCATAVTYSRDIPAGVVEFGVSGLLYQSNLLMYDRKTHSLWSQVGAESVVGSLAGEKLEFVKSNVARFGWVKTLEQHVQVLSTDTGYARDYRSDPYEGYGESADIFFPVAKKDDRLHPKDFVYGIEINGVAKAYAKSLLRENPVIDDIVGGANIRIEFDPVSESLHIQNMNLGLELIPIPAFWFSWVAVHPDTELYK